MLGTVLARYLRGRGEEVIGWDLPEHDVTQVDKTINGIHRVRPEVVFHLAAVTDVDGCEKDQGKATSVNFQGTWAVALGAEEIGCKLVYMSTDYVFDGQSRRPYREKDETEPLSVYGRSKLMGEKAVVRACRRRFIVRTSWLYGPHGRNFVDTIRMLAREKDRLEVVGDQVGSPTYTQDLCEPLYELAGSVKYDTYHMTNSGQCSWYELAREVVEVVGADSRVIPIDTGKSGRPAPRPVFSVLENRNLHKRFGRQLRPWQEALRDYLGETPAT